jgi:hypothetical protein
MNNQTILNNQTIMNNAMNNENNMNLNIQMNPDNFYAYVNTLINQGYTKYNAVIMFLNDNNINANYKTIPEVQEELDYGIQLLNNYNIY